MPPKQRLSPRRRRNPRRRNRRRVGPTGAVTNPGSRMTRVVRTYQYTTVSTLTDSGKVDNITITLLQLLGATSAGQVGDWYDEFKIMNVELWCYGVEIGGGSAGLKRTTGLAVVADRNNRVPTNCAELLRMAGARLFSLDFSRGPIKLATIKPAFDETGSSNHFVSDWLTTGSDVAQKAIWYGFCVSTPDSTTSGDQFHLSLKATVAFRGLE